MKHLPGLFKDVQRPSSVSSTFKALNLHTFKDFQKPAGTLRITLVGVTKLWSASGWCELGISLATIAAALKLRDWTLQDWAVKDWTLTNREMTHR